MIAWLMVLLCAVAQDRAAYEAWVSALDDPSHLEDAGGYLTAAGHHRAIRDAIADHPEVRVEHIGEAVSGAPLWAIHVPAAVHAQRSVLVFAGLHAMEWIGTEVAVATLHDLLEGRPPHTDVTVIPLLNPDGRARVEEDLAAGANVYRRGNLRFVDLNRDFAWHRDCQDGWDKLLPRYHRASHAPLSQPESRALDALAARERYDRAASLHAFGGFFYFPWSGTWARPPHWASFVTLGRAMEQAQGPRAYKTRQLSRWGFFFRAHGSEIDHLYGSYGTLAFLVELTRSGIRPFKAKDYKTYFRWYNPVDRTRHLDKGVAAMRALIETELPSTEPVEHGRKEPIHAVPMRPGTEVGPVDDVSR